MCLDNQESHFSSESAVYTTCYLCRGHTAQFPVMPIWAIPAETAGNGKDNV